MSMFSRTSSRVFLLTTFLFTGLFSLDPRTLLAQSCSRQNINSGSTLNGNLSNSDCSAPHRSGNKADLYTFEGIAGQRVTIAMSSSAFDTYLIVQGPLGNVLFSDDDGGDGSNSLINNVLLTSSGRYTIEASSFASSGRGSYALRLTVAGAASCTPTAVPTSGSINGTLSNGDCNAPHRSGAKADVYTFTATAGQRVTINMTSAAFDTYLLLVGPGGNVLANDDDGGDGNNSRISSFVLPSAGTFRIEASAFSGSGRGSYNLSVTLTGGTAGCTPASLPLASSVGGNLSNSDCDAPHRPGAKADVYTLTATAGQRATLAMNSSAFDAYLILVGPGGNVVASNDDGGGGNNSLINNVTLTSGGTYRVEATAFSGGGRGAYTLRLTLAGGTAGCTPTALPLASSVGGSLSNDDCEAPHRPGAKADLYTFSGSAGQQATIAMSSSAFDTYLILVGPGGNVVASDDDGGDGNNSLIENFTLPSSGTFTLEASAFGGSSRGSYVVSVSFNGQLACLIFVHGSRADDAAYDWSQDWQAGRNYWREKSFPHELLNDQQDFIRAATNGFSRPYFVVRYNGAAAWWDAPAAGQVTEQIVRATNGEADGGGNRCSRTAQNGGVFWVITHSGGANVLDFILGNSRTSDPNYNSTGRYDLVAARISGVLSVGGAHRGTPAADIICDAQDTRCPQLGKNCTSARTWLQTRDPFQVNRFASAPAKMIWLTGGYKNFTGSCTVALAGEDDTVLTYASQFACSGSALQAFNNSNVCGNRAKQESSNFANLDAAYEDHDDEKNNYNTVRDRARTSIPDGIWECSGQTCAANTRVRENLSTADFLDDLLREFFHRSRARGISLRPLRRAAAESYRVQARYPSSSSPIQTSLDPLLRERTVTPSTALGPDETEPTLTVYPAAVSFEAPEPVVLHAHLTERTDRLPAAHLVGTITGPGGTEVGSVEFLDDGLGHDTVAGDLLYTAVFAPAEGQERAYRGIHSVSVRAAMESGESRACTTAFHYSAPDSSLTGRFRERLVDGSLRISAQVEVTAAGRFHLEGTLYTSDGKPLAWAQEARELGVGRHWIPLTFYGLALREAGADGPYVLKYLALSTTTAMPSSPNRLVENAYTTAPYRAADFIDRPFDDPALLEEAAKLLMSP